MEIIILTGMSGAGKTNAAHTLEDLGYYCVDNMPAVMMPEFVRIYEQIPNKSSGIVFVIDIRSENEFDTLISWLNVIKNNGEKCRIIFLDCADEYIINRYKETRRVHPFTATRGMNIKDAINLERDLLTEAKQKADYRIDTSKLTVQQLKERVTSIVMNASNGNISVTCMSFGFKYGIPSESDLVFDVRCFPNPFYVEALREKNGLDAEVADYVMSHKPTVEFLEKLYNMIDFLLPQFISDGRTHIIVAIGCTGGKHRSVCLAEQLKAHIKEHGMDASSMHRDIFK